MLETRKLSTRTVRMLGVVAVAGCAVALTFGVPMVRAEGDAKPSIKDIMKADHKGDNSLAKKVSTGKATPDEISKLLADYKVMADEAPELGSKDDWKDRMTKLIAATEEVKSGEKDGITEFKAAVNCKACHELHKAKK